VHSENCESGDKTETILLRMDGKKCRLEGDRCEVRCGQVYDRRGQMLGKK